MFLHVILDLPYDLAVRVCTFSQHSNLALETLLKIWRCDKVKLKN